MFYFLRPANTYTKYTSTKETSQNENPHSNEAYTTDQVLYDNNQKKSYTLSYFDKEYSVAFQEYVTLD